jgi:outer membrane protein assembly factor BamD (BamD/ComL family)
MEGRVHSKRLVSVGLAAIMSLAIAIPAFAQGNENKDYQAIQDERDQRKQRDLLEAFLKNYPNSQHRPDYDIQLITLYYGNKDWQQMIKLADNFVQQQGTADPKAKTNLYTLAMEGARQLGNTSKFNEYADRALTADPNNISVLMTMSRSLSENPPADATARNAAFDKALGYAQRAQKAPKPDKMTDADWQGTQNRVHGIVGVIYFNQGKWVEASDELAEFLKTNPNDGPNQYRYGAAMFSQVQATLANLQALNNDAQLAQKADRDLGPYIDRMNARTKEFETQRDITIDAMAKALAIGGPFATSATAIITPLYKQKNNGSEDGLPAFIASKKAELAALAPLPPPAVGARGAGTQTGGKPNGK